MSYTELLEIGNMRGKLSAKNCLGEVISGSKCYDPGSDFSARLLTGYDYGTPQVSSHISHGQSSQSAE